MGYCDGIGDIGRFQWCCILLYGIACGCNITTVISILFAAPKMDFYCDDPTDIFRNLSDAEQKFVMTSGKGRCFRPDMDFGVFQSTDDLLTFVNNSVQQTNATTGGSYYGALAWRKCDTGFRYDRKLFDYTATEQYTMVCDRKWLVSMAKTLYMLGYLVGAIVAGAVSDRVGRKFTAIVFASMVVAFNILSGFAPIVEIFLVSRFLVGASSIGFYTSGFVLCTELMRKDQRKYPRAVLSISINLSVSLFAVVSMGLRDHRWDHSFIAVCMAVYTVLMYLFLPESVRWLMSQNRPEEAKRVIQRIAKFNNWPEEKLAHLLVTDTKTQDDDAEALNSDGTIMTNNDKKATIRDLFRTPIIRKRLLIMCTIWFCHVMTYYMLIFNLGSFYPDVRISLLISGAIELFTIFIPIFGVDTIGRQLLTFCFLGIAGLCCLGMTPIRLHIAATGRFSPFLLALALTGKLMVVNQFFVSYIYTQELFPTVVRSQGLGLASSVSRIGAMLAPQIVLLDDLWPATSVVVVGLCATLGGALVPFLPDTTHCELPQTLGDGESLRAKHRYKLMWPGRTTSQRRRKANNNDNTEPMNGDAGEHLKCEETRA